MFLQEVLPLTKDQSYDDEYKSNCCSYQFSFFHSICTTKHRFIINSRASVERKALMNPSDNASHWACSLAWIGRQSPKLQIAGSNPARSVRNENRLEGIETTDGVRSHPATPLALYQCGVSVNKPLNMWPSG